MALPILDGNQSATTLSTILSGGQHITAHTVVSLGTQAITDIVNATSAGLTNTQLRASAVTVGGTVTVGNSLTISSLPAISGTVTANLDQSNLRDALDYFAINYTEPLPVSIQNEIFGTVTIGSALPAGTNRIGVVTIGNIQRSGDGVQSSLLTEAGSGYLLTKSTLNAGSEQIGSVTASISGTVPISISSVTIGSIPPIQWSNANGGDAPTTVNQNAPLPVQLYTGAVPSSVTIGAIIANSVTIGSLPAISGTVTANTFALQGTAVTTSNFTSTTASTVLANYNATREVLTIFNEGAGNLHVSVGATCTTIAYQVRLSAGDYYEVPNHQTTITHSAVFATAGTARVTEVS